MTDRIPQNKTGARAMLAGTALVAATLGVLALTATGSFAADNKKDTKTLNEITPASAGASATAPANGQPSGDEGQMIKLGNPTVAIINGEEIKRADVLSFISGLPEQVRQMPLQNLFPLALEQVVNNRLVSAKAKEAKLDNDPEVQKLIDQAKGQIVRNVYVQKQVDAAMTEKRLLKAYEKVLNEMGEVQEVHARHILVDSEDKAKEVIKKLGSGSKFDDLAKEYSKGPSSDNGGDLGYFAQSEMVPEFANAAFALKKGEISKAPVKTQFGWHIISVEDKRKRPEPKFEDVKPQLETQVRQEILGEILDKWQKSAKIQKFDINGEPVKDKQAKK